METPIEKVIQIPELNIETDLNQFSQKIIKYWLEEHRPTGQEPPAEHQLWHKVSNFWTERDLKGLDSN